MSNSLIDKAKEIALATLSKYNDRPYPHIEITLTNSCNLKCKYCFEADNLHAISDIKNGDINSSTPECDTIRETKTLELITNLLENWVPSEYKGLTISFWGGEPTLNLSYLKKIIVATHKYNFVRYHMYSNGVLLNKYSELINFISSLNFDTSRFDIQLSYDGEPQHSLLRGNNKEEIFQVAQLLANTGFNLSFKATLTFDMIKYLPDIWDSYKELYDRFGDCVSYSPTLDTTKALEEFLADWENNLIKIASKEINFIKNNGRPLMNWWEDKEAKISCNLSHHIHIHTDGNLYRCHGCPYLDKETLKLGSLENTTNLKSIFSKTINTKKLSMGIECERCTATYCAVCHVNYIKEDAKKEWLSCRSVDTIRCKYFKIFGVIKRAMNLARISN